jgi:hypothetical protein
MIASVHNFDTGERIPNLQKLEIRIEMGGAVCVSGSKPYVTGLQAEVTYWDNTDSGITTKQFAAIEELTIRYAKGLDRSKGCSTLLPQISEHED